MKKTGMIRKIDELGRIVIPKEIRQTLRLKEGMSLELYINEQNEIVLKEYSNLLSVENLTNIYCMCLENKLNKEVFVCNRSKIVNYYGEHKKQYINKQINGKLIELIFMAENYVGEKKDGTTILDVLVEKDENVSGEIFFPIIVNKSCEGLIGVLNFNDCKITPIDILAVELTAKFIQGQICDD